MLEQGGFLQTLADRLLVLGAEGPNSCSECVRLFLLEMFLAAWMIQYLRTAAWQAGGQMALGVHLRHEHRVQSCAPINRCQQRVKLLCSRSLILQLGQRRTLHCHLLTLPSLFPVKL